MLIPRVWRVKGSKWAPNWEVGRGVSATIPWGLVKKTPNPNQELKKRNCRALRAKIETARMSQEGFVYCKNHTKCRFLV